MGAIKIQEIFNLLPHRYPFLLVDRVLEWKAGESIIAIKNVTIGEPCFMGHFPVRPVMPGVLMIEALAQAAGILAYKSTESWDPKKSLFFLGSVEKTRFKRVVQPGDQLKLTIEVKRKRLTVWKVLGIATVEDELCCSSEITCLQDSIKDD